MQHGPGLTVALDAIRDTLQELCSSAADADSTATQAKLLQPAVAQLTAVVMLASQRDSSHRTPSRQAHLSPADLQRAASELALLALEMRYVMASQSIEPVRQVLLAAHDIKSLTGGRLGALQQLRASYNCNICILSGAGCQSDAVLDMLLREPFPCVSSSSPEATCVLWEIMYKAALQVKPPGELQACCFQLGTFAAYAPVYHCCSTTHTQVGMHLSFV